MREFTGSAMNTIFAEEEEKLKPMAEIILLLSEPEYMPDGLGTITRRRTVSSIRFGASEGALRGLAKHLVEYANTIAEAGKRHERYEVNTTRIHRERSR